MKRKRCPKSPKNAGGGAALRPRLLRRRLTQKLTFLRLREVAPVFSASLKSHQCLTNPFISHTESGFINIAPFEGNLKIVLFSDHTSKQG